MLEIQDDIIAREVPYKCRIQEDGIEMLNLRTQLIEDLLYSIR